MNAKLRNWIRASGHSQVALILLVIFWGANLPLISQAAIGPGGLFSTTKQELHEEKLAKQDDHDVKQQNWKGNLREKMFTNYYFNNNLGRICCVM